MLFCISAFIWVLSLSVAFTVIIVLARKDEENVELICVANVYSPHFAFLQGCDIVKLKVITVLFLTSIGIFCFRD